MFAYLDIIESLIPSTLHSLHLRIRKMVFSDWSSQDTFEAILAQDMTRPPSQSRPSSPPSSLLPRSRSSSGSYAKRTSEETSSHHQDSDPVNLQGKRRAHSLRRPRPSTRKDPGKASARGNPTLRLSRSEATRTELQTAAELAGTRGAIAASVTDRTRFLQRPGP
ncbi:hypothetical protein BDY21DRAFT_418393 [Lineolata rhizophorae]|uniref:Uncharacterized protein n=1 Tax=Lineolata rhizophorae TaxID=578093 RepID=A0A6A6PBX4_9PEZI|nr:hypothetical protein BDY21DRAFT_418393 [Lineolata rhizophorae]